MLRDRFVLHLRLTLREIVLLTLLPIVLAAVFVVVARLSGLNRYEAAYFTEAYLQRYSTPGSAALALQEALRTDDAQLLAELQGLRRTRRFAVSPHMSLTILYEIQGPYYTYLYYDTRTYRRSVHHFEDVGGRWIVVPEDAYYSLRSGAWLKTFTPMALTWWITEAVFLLGYGVYRLGQRWRAEMLSYKPRK